MEKLFINNIEIDLPEKAVGQTLQINDIGDVKDRQANYSNNIKIPRTSKNISAFEYLGIAGNTTDKPYENLAINYSVDGIELISEGYGVIKNTNGDYNLVIYDGNKELSNLLESKELNLLDFSAHNHNLTESLFLNSFTKTDGYIYALGRYYEDAQTSVFNLSTINVSFYQHTLFEMIFSQKGYSISGDFLSDADFKNRVVSMSIGHDQLINSDLAEVYSRSNVGDAEVNETFSNFTNKDYLIDTYTATTSSTHEVSLIGSVFILQGDNAKIIVKRNGAQVAYFNIFTEADFNQQLYIQAESGDAIAIYVNLDSEDFSNKISFYTNYNTIINQNDLYIDINIEELIGDTKQLDFVKEVMQHYGLLFRKIRNKNEFEFIRIKDLISDKASAEDWSDKYSEVLNESYKPNYAKINNFKYKYDDDDTNTEQTFGNGALTVINETIADEKTVVTSIFKASTTVGSYCNLEQWTVKDGELTPNNDGLRYFKLLQETDRFNYRFKAGENYVTYNGTVATLQFEPLYYINDLTDHYSEFNLLLNDYKLIKLNLFLSLIDIYNLDFFKLKYFKQLGKYYYLNKVSDFKKGKKTKVELVEVPPAALEFIPTKSMTSHLRGGSTLEAILTKAVTGGLYATLEGGSSLFGLLTITNPYTITGFNRIIAGQVVWTGVGYVFESVNLVYELNGAIYISHGDTVTLSAPDTNPRFDVIYADVDGIDFKEGIPAVSPIEPALEEPANQIKTNLVLVQNATTTPSEINLDAVYSENLQETGGEWDSSETGTSFDLANTVAPINLTKDIKSSASVALDSFEFNHSTAIDLEYFDNIRLKVKSLGYWGADYLIVSLYNGTEFIGQNYIKRDTFNTTDTTTIQDVFLLKADFFLSEYATNTSFDTIRFKVVDGGSGGTEIKAQFDLIQVGYGGTTIKPTILGKASETTYDNTDSNLKATNVKTALDELDLNLQKEITASYSIVNDDNKYTIFINSATAVTITINTLTLDNFECDFYNLGAGLVTFADGTATASYPDGTTLDTDKVCALLRFMATTTYKLKGELS